MNIKILMSTVVALAGIGSITWYLLSQQHSQPVTEKIVGVTVNDTPTQSTPASNAARSSSEIVDAISNQVASLKSTSGQPSFSIQSTQRIDNIWYVTTIASTSMPSSAKVIMKDNGSDGGLIVVAGPGTFFPDTTPVPDNVKRVL